MDGVNIRDFWSSEVESMLLKYRQFETLIPKKDKSKMGSDSNAEDGRFIESLLKEQLQKNLPKGLEVLTGFILRPTVKIDDMFTPREGEDRHSTQLDLIVFDSERYPTYLRFGDTVVVPPEGVIAIISVKKNMRDGNIQAECSALREASLLCTDETKRKSKKNKRGPFLALVSMGTEMGKLKKKDRSVKLFDQLESVYKDEVPFFDDMVGYVGALKEWSIFKEKPTKNARYLYFDHSTPGYEHLGFQFILSGILSVYYDETQGRNITRPGFTAFAFKKSDGDRKITCII